MRRVSQQVLENEKNGNNPKISPQQIATSPKQTAKVKLIPNEKDKAVQSSASLPKTPLASSTQAKAIVSSSANNLSRKIAVNQPVQNIGMLAPQKLKLPNPKPPKFETVKQPVSSGVVLGATKSPMDTVIAQNISDRGLAHTATGGLGMMNQWGLNE